MLSSMTASQIGSRDGLAELLGGGDEDHRHREALHLARRWNHLRFEQARLAVISQDQAKQIERLIREAPFSGRGAVRRQTDDRKGFREQVPALPQRTALARHRKEHATVRIEGVPIQEVDAVLREREPFLTPIDGGVQTLQAAMQICRAPRWVCRSAVPIRHDPVQLCTHRAYDQWRCGSKTVMCRR